MAVDESEGKPRDGSDADNAPRKDQPGDALARQMGELARPLQAEEGEADVLAGMVGAAVELIPGAEEASISLVRGRRKVESCAPSGPLARQLDELQEKSGQGPCLDAAFEHQTVSVPDLAHDDRWPQFAHAPPPWARGACSPSSSS